MGIYEFIALDEDSKANTVWQDGKFLAMREEAGFRLALYELDDFFVQVHYDPTENSIVKIPQFKSMTLLEPYWTAVELPEL